MIANTAEGLIEETQLSPFDTLLKNFNPDQQLWLSGHPFVQDNIIQDQISQDTP